MLCLDASVCVKWFKESERFKVEAIKLLDLITRFRIEAVANEWISLEVTRGLKRAQLKEKQPILNNEDIEESYRSIEDLFESTALYRVKVDEVKEVAKDLEINLNLYAADAVHLATAIVKKMKYLVTDDDHLLKKSVKEYGKLHGVKIVTLDSLMERLESKE